MWVMGTFDQATLPLPGQRWTRDLSLQPDSPCSWTRCRGASGGARGGSTFRPGGGSVETLELGLMSRDLRAARLLSWT